jgi:hypothetical protein
MNRRTPRPSCTNQASTDVANEVRKCNQPDFCRCGRGAVLADWCRGGRRDQEHGYRYRSTHEGDFLSGSFQALPTGLLPVWLGLRSEVGNKFTSVLPSLPDRSGPTHDTGSAPAAQNLAAALLRISRGHQYRRLFLTDRSKPVSARRSLPTLTLPAHPETAFDDKREQGAGSFGRARDSLVAPTVTLDAFIALRGRGHWYLARTSALVV